MAGPYRGVSAEFMTLCAKLVEMGDNPLMEIREDRLLRASMVDDGGRIGAVPNNAGTAFPRQGRPRRIAAGVVPRA